MAQTIIGVMGPGDGATPDDLALAEELGRLIAQRGWVLLTGGRSAGVMEAASKGAKETGGLTIGILPFNDFDAAKTSAFVDIPIMTGMGEARNAINVLSSQVVLVCGMGSGTASEAALALKANRPVVLVAPDESASRFFASLGNPLRIANDAGHAVEIVKELLGMR
jgi:uncharacterized protein (TIGR00725 family)